MSPYEKVQLVIQSAATVGLFATVFVYHRQLRTMQQQLQAMRQGSIGQSMLALEAFLMAEDTRAARTVVIRTLCAKRVPWSDDERAAAAKVCSTYDSAGYVVRGGLVPLRSFLESWGQSIRRCYEAVQPYLEEMRRADQGGPAYWESFRWLYAEFAKLDSVSQQHTRAAVLKAEQGLPADAHKDAGG